MKRNKLLKKIEEEYEVHQVCALLGPRQSGKTTLAKTYMKNIDDQVHFFDCENFLHLSQLENPLLTLEPLKGLVVIDEVQLKPDLFGTLRVLVDNNPDQRFLITGSASRDLIHQSSETLAGRIGYHQITPFSLEEVDSNWQRLWEVGGFPKSFLAKSSKISERWRDEYIKTFLERDILGLGLEVSPQVAGKLWRMLAHMHGQILNMHNLSKSLGIDQRTVKRYLNILEGAFMITLLRPWYTNVGKREIKSPKVYIRDSGILHRLLNFSSENFQFNPSIGSSFEGFVVEEISRYFDCYENAYFWATHNGAELDLIINKGMKKIGFEVKYTDKPCVTKSMRIASEALELEHLYVIIPGTHNFRLDEKITCLGIANCSDLISK
ncbi:ATP-binding protein [Candidatus Phycorickettsia trachydisci]|uniref:ATP-binding protein n=1 Tax=Candidatus Phycorickettsia trachydisci TaxID=2115978 RepID=UPI0039774C54